jgi:hypothetical protein
MAIWMVSFIAGLSNQYGRGSGDAERMGTVIGGTIGASVIMWTWVFGAIILGLMMFFTRDEKVIITRTS